MMELPELEEIRAFKFWEKGYDAFRLAPAKHRQIKGLKRARKRTVRIATQPRRYRNATSKT